MEGLPNGILFWRSFTHWIGGMGVLVFLLSLLPLTGGSHVNPVSYTHLDVYKRQKYR